MPWHFIPNKKDSNGQQMETGWDSEPFRRKGKSLDCVGNVTTISFSVLPLGLSSNATSNEVTRALVV